MDSPTITCLPVVPLEIIAQLLPDGGRVTLARTCSFFRSFFEALYLDKPKPSRSSAVARCYSVEEAKVLVDFEDIKNMDLLVLLAAIEHNSLTLYRTMKRKGLMKSKKVLPAAVASGNIEMVKEAETYLSIPDWESKTKDDLTLLEMAIKGNYIDIVEYLLGKQASRSTELCRLAIEHCRPEILKLVHEEPDCPCGESVHEMAIEFGQLECLKYIHEQYGHCGFGKSNDFSQGVGLCYKAASRGFLEKLKFLHENGYYWSKRTCDIAVINGNLECLKYAVEHGCERSNKLLTLAAEDGQVEIVEYLLSSSLIHSSSKKVAKKIRSHLISAGNTSAMNLLTEKGYQWTEKDLVTAARDSMSSLEYLIGLGIEVTLKVYEAAIEYDSHIRLHYLFNSTKKWDDKLCKIIIKHDAVNCFNYASEMGHFNLHEARKLAVEKRSGKCFKIIESKRMEAEKIKKAKENKETIAGENAEEVEAAILRRARRATTRTSTRRPTTTPGTRRA